MNLFWSIILFLSMGVSAQGLEDLLNNHLDVTADDVKEIETTTEQIVEDPIQTISHQIDISDGYYSLYVVIGLMVTAIIMMKMVLSAISNSKHNTPEHINMGAGLIVVIFSTLILVNAATSTEALMAAIGIIGSVAGYVLGHSKKEKEGKRSVQIRKNDKKVE